MSTNADPGRTRERILELPRVLAAVLLALLLGACARPEAMRPGTVQALTLGGPWQVGSLDCPKHCDDTFDLKLAARTKVRIETGIAPSTQRVAPYTLILSSGSSDVARKAGIHGESTALQIELDPGLYIVRIETLGTGPPLVYQLRVLATSPPVATRP